MMESEDMADEVPAKPIREDLVKSVLATLTEITSQIHAEDDFKKEIEKQLWENGFGFFDETQENNTHAEHVVKVLMFAVNNAMVTKIEIAPGDATSSEHDSNNTDPVTGELNRLLKIDEGKSIDDYMAKDWTDTLVTATSPLDLAQHVKKSAPLPFVKNLLKHQFDIKWATESGEPCDFTFFEFGEQQGTTKHLKYKPRKAQTMVRLYKECRRRSPRELRFTEEQLCPVVYVRTTEGWRGWDATRGIFEAANCNEDFQWMDEEVRSFILENADEMRIEGDCDQKRSESIALERSLEKPALYWAVVYDDFKSGENSLLKEIGNTQVYVGKAENGIRGRWLDERGSHCAEMKRCVDNTCVMTTYDPMRLKGIELVDARLALAKVRRDNCAVFLVRSFGDDVEKAAIVREKAVAACAAANTEWKKAKKSCAETTEKLKRAAQSQQPDRIKELRRATRAADGAKEAVENASGTVKDAQQAVQEAEDALEESKDPTPGVVSERLRNAEARHREGKRMGRTNTSIVPHDGDNSRLQWKPKNMAFGMNRQ